MKMEVDEVLEIGGRCLEETTQPYCDEEYLDTEDTDTEKASDGNDSAIFMHPIIHRTFRRRPRNHFLSVADFTDAQMRHFCGIRLIEFTKLYDVLKSRKNLFERWIDRKDQMALTLMKYRHNYSYRRLANFYDINKKVVFRVFHYWTSKLYKFFKGSIPLFMERRNLFKSYTAILSCVELKTYECPDNPELNRKLFSMFEFSNTFKYLVAMDERGYVIFCSDIFGGGMSNNEVFDKSVVTKILRPGDIVLAGWNDGLQQKLRKQKVKLHTTSYERIYRSLMSNERPPNDEKIMEHRKLMLQQTKVVRKRFNILRQKVAIVNWSIFNKVVFVVNMLHNVKVFRGAVSNNES